MAEDIFSDICLILIGCILLSIVILSIYFHYRQWSVRYIGKERESLLDIIFLKRM